MTLFKKNQQIFLLSALILISLICISESKNKKSNKNKKSRSKLSNETNVININETIFPSFNETNSQYFLLFHAKWKSGSNDFEPIYDEASVKAKSLGWNVTFAKIDVQENNNLVKSWQASSFPVVYWVDNSENELIEVDKPYSVNVLMRFINTSLNINTENLADFNSLQEKKKSGKYLVFVGDKERHNHEYRRFVKVARDDQFDYIYDTNSAEFFTRYGIDSNSYDAVFFKIKNKTLNEGERMNLKTGAEMTKGYLEKMFEIFLRLPWGKFKLDDLYHSVQSGAVTPTLFVIYNQSATNNHLISDSLFNLQKKYKLDYWFLNSTYDYKNAYFLTEVFNITEEKLPYYILVKDNRENTDDVDKYVLSSGQALSQSELESLLEKLHQGKLDKFIYSEPLPDKEFDEHGIQKIVGSNFVEKVFNSNLDKDLLLFLCTDGNKRCRQSKEIFLNVVRKLSENANLNFGEINTAYNEIAYLEYEKLPSFVLLKKSNNFEERKSKVNIYDGRISTLSIVNWVKNETQSLNEKLLESEELLLKQESKRPLKSAKKNNEEFYSNLEDGHTIGLRRSISIDFEPTSSFMNKQENLEELLDKQNDKPPKKMKKEL